MATTKVRKRRTRNNDALNFKIPNDTYKELQLVGDGLGGMTVSTLVRMLVYACLDRAKKAKNPLAFIDMALRQSEEKRLKDINLNIRIPERYHNQIDNIADEIGVNTSTLVRMAIYAQLEKVKETNDVRNFLELKRKRASKKGALETE